MKLQVKLRYPGRAEGRYIIKAKNCIIAILRWGNERGALAGWSPFAYVPIDSYGNGCFCFSGKRAIPAGITHIHVKCVLSDFSDSKEFLSAIPEQYIKTQTKPGERKEFSILTDMHFTTKAGKIKQALRAADCETVFLLGDSTNDGTKEQFDNLMDCIEEAVPDKVVLGVVGNHDILQPSETNGNQGFRNYAGFHNFLMERARIMGVECNEKRKDYAFSVQYGEIDIIGLQCVISGRRFLFPQKAQIQWIAQHLEKHREAKWHIILCHAPLLAHNPNRNTGTPYLDSDRDIQEIIEKYGNTIFLSGHTHVSPNTMTGCAELDGKKNIIYLNCGSVVTTSLESEIGLMDSGWKDGCVIELRVWDDEIEILTKSVLSGLYFPRGYYRFSRDEEGLNNR